MGEAPLLGSPSITMDNSIVQYTGQTGFKVNGGTVGPVTNSSVFHCRFGLLQQLSSSVDFSGGGNTIACNTNQEPGNYGGANATPAGINAWNSSLVNSMNVANVLWADTPPGLWECFDGSTISATNCTCVSGSCTGSNQATPDQADAIYYSNTTATNPIDMSDAGQQMRFGICQ
jgi:hypothetical protein